MFVSLRHEWLRFTRKCSFPTHPRVFGGIPPDPPFFAGGFAPHTPLFWRKSANLKPMQNQPIKLAIIASLILHLPLILPAISLAILNAINPDLLGLRGGKQWAESIKLQNIPPQHKTLTPSLEVRIVTAIPKQDPPPPEENKDPHALHKKQNPNNKPRRADKAPQEPIRQADSPSASEGAKQSAAAKAGLDALGNDEGDSDQNAKGLFLSGGEAKLLLAGWTFRGSNGFLDGSIAAARDKRRQAIPWRIYYARDGQLRARFSRMAAAYPHGPIAVRDFWSSGRWWVKGDYLCQRIEAWFYGSPICFALRREGRALAMYYAECWGVARCYRGRLGPRGVIVRGRRLN